MRQSARLLLVVSALFAPDRVDAQTPISVSARVGDFHVAVSNYYQVPQREVVVIRDRRIRDEDSVSSLYLD